MVENTLRLLMIDDNPDDRSLMLRELEREFDDLQVVELPSRDRLPEMLEKDDFDIVITDYQLRSTTGIDILRAIKRKKPLCPVIMFTGTGDEEIAVKAMKMGLDDYVIKSPKHFVRLAAAVRSAWEREKLRRARYEAEMRYRRLFEGVPMGLYRLSREGKILDANPALIQLLGYRNRQDLLSRARIDTHIEAAIYEAWKNQLDSEETVEDREIQLWRCDSKPLWVRHNARAVKDEKGELLYYEGALEDITDRRQVEQERDRLFVREQEAREEAETANRLKDEFLATLSHELRTPLNAMMGWVQLVRTNKLSTEQVARALETIERNANTQAQLINDILDVSRIIRGNVQLQLAPLDLEKVIGATVESLQPTAQAKNVALIAECEPTVDLVSADGERLQQIVWNLAVNGIKFTPKGGSVTVRLSYDETRATIQVIDTGIGIEAEFLPYIFERFRQVEGTSKRSHGGLGLGLAIVRHLVELHGGTVAAKSAGPGQGSAFAVKLPLIEGNSIKKQPQSEVDCGESELSPLAGMTILVVEDEADSREFLSLVLEGCGATVIAADSVGEALGVLDKKRPDVLVSDIAMPGEDGYDLIGKIRDRPDGTFPAIALTAYAREKDEQRAIEAGFQVHLTKPLDAEKLMAAIARLTQREIKN
ncbi:MAG: response regulator [Cyanobacteriota bacterium]|nr:response regulator [Cyanobacteriota bacterium]